MREVQPWAEWELELLESHYCLDGSAFITQRTGRSADSIRQKATRLQLRAEMHDFTPASDVRKQAGVHLNAVLHWIDRHHYRRHTRSWGRHILMPAPMVRQYLHATRTDKRPAGWWGRARVADHLGCAITKIPTTLSYRTVGRTRYYDPQEVSTHHRPAPPATMLRLRDIYPRAGATWSRALDTLKGHTMTFPRHQRGRPAVYVSESAARDFLTARGHRQEQIDTLIRKALAMQASKIKEEK